MANDETIDDKFLNAVIEYNRQIDNTYDDKILKDIQEFLNAGANVNYQSINGTTAIVEAAGYGTPELVKLLLAAGANVNLKDGEKIKALTKALEHKENPNIEIVKLLINAGADLNVVEKDDEPPLFWAIVYNNIELVKLLLAAGANVNLKDEETSRTALTKALEHNENPNIEIVKLLINAGADPNVEDGEPLFWAIEYNNSELINMLISAGADVNKASALITAVVRNEDPELVKLLLAAGANVNLSDGDKNTALTKALEYNENPNIEIIKILINAGADLNVNNGEPLFWAIEFNNIELVNILISAGADVNIGIEDGYSGDLPEKSSQLIFASVLERAEIVKILLAVPGIDINLQNKYGDTALIVACKERNAEIVKLLLAVPEININLKNEYGDTALIITCRKGNVEIVKLLLADPKIDINLKNTYGDTALAVSTVENNLIIVNILLINGADINIIDNAGNKAIDYVKTHAMQNLLSAPSASLMMGKTNRGVIDIPDDNKTNSIAFDDITDGETVIRIQQFGKDFFYRLESWKEFMYNQLKNYPREPIINPINRAIVTADQIDIFTAHIVPVVQNAPVVGSKRPRPANLRGGTRRRRITRRVNKKRATRRRRI